MSQGNCASIDIGGLMAQSQLLDDSQRLHRKSFVKLYQPDVIDGEPGTM